MVLMVLLHLTILANHRGAARLRISREEDGTNFFALFYFDLFTL